MYSEAGMAKDKTDNMLVQKRLQSDVVISFLGGERVRTTCHQLNAKRPCTTVMQRLLNHTVKCFFKYIHAQVAVQLSVGDVSSAIHLDILTRSTMKAGVLHTLGGTYPQRDSSFRVTERRGKRCKFKV